MRSLEGKKAVSPKNALVVFGYLILTTAIMLLGTVIGQLLVVLGCKAMGLSHAALLAEPRSAALLQDALLLAPAVAYVALTFAWIRWRERTPLPAFFVHPFARLMQGAILGLLMWGIAVGLAASVGDVALPMPLKAPQNLIPLLTIVGWAAQATGEEFIYRGWLLTRLRARFAISTAIIISAVIFSLTHGLNPETTPVAYVNLALAGIWFALLSLREGGIVMASGAHIMWNWLEGSGTGMWSRGDEAQGGQLFDFSYASHGLLGGPGTGMNDGFALGIAFSLLILLELGLRRGSSRRKLVP